MKILGATVGNCVHVGGIQSFMRIAQSLGNDCRLLGTGVTNDRLVESIKEMDPEMVVISYRLSPDPFQTIIDDLIFRLCREGLQSRRFLFGGTSPVAKIAKDSGLFEATFIGGESREEVEAAIRGVVMSPVSQEFGNDIVERIELSYPRPLIRHHFGLPSLEDTIKGAAIIAERGSLDILSIAPDQNAQECFFRPEEMDLNMNGAGGVPLRNAGDLRRIYKVTRRGNHPLLRCYSGTRDLLPWAEMLRETVHNVWGAVPLAWYSELDGRSSRSLVQAIKENQEAIRWHAQRGIPVEVTDSHQWSLRSSGDTIELASAYICAYNAHALGVRNYVCQFMFDTPKGMSPAMDLAKMLAKVELVESMAGDDFHIIRMVRSGLNSLSAVPGVAKGQLASSIFSAMSLRPHIVHVVGFCEADHAATPDEIHESCLIARGTIEKALKGVPQPMADPEVKARKTHLLNEVRYLINAIKREGVRNEGDPLTSPENLAEIIKQGLFDAPDLKGSIVAKGRIITAIVNGGCDAIKRGTLEPITEKKRLAEFFSGDETLDIAEM
jgi:hypothetical protein